MSSMDSSSSENKYVIDIEQAAETVRLIEQDRIFTLAQGGLFPERPNLSNVQHLLDIACGPGAWALRVAFAYPDIEVIGVDINQTMIDYAIAQANVQKLQNIAFEVMNVRQPLAFQDASFDLVNARLLVAFMDKAAWPVLLAECHRILRPGGIIRLTELETTITNSLAMQRLQTYLCQALAQQGRTFSADGCSFGITYMLRKLLTDAGFTEVQGRAFHLDGSFGTDLHPIGVKDAEMAYALVKPYLIKTGIAEESEYDHIYTQMMNDILQEDFLGLTYGLTAWAVKPA